MVTSTARAHPRNPSHCPPADAIAQRALDAALVDPLNSWWWYALAKAGVSESQARSALWSRSGPDGQAVRALAFGYQEFRDAA